MTESIIQMLHGLDVPDERIKLESFATAGRREPTASGPVPDEHAGEVETTPSAGATAASVTFARAGKSKPISASQTVLEASEDLGVNIEYDCRSGICGTCKTKLVSGRVTMDVEDALVGEDRANNVILSCQARCLDRVVVEA